MRKVVTVVFTDVVGSTALGERLDPESLRSVMWRYFEAVKATLERHGGVVEKFIGDAAMAVFGVPAVHEDDPLRAVRAALELRGALEPLNAELERAHGIRIVTRTGVNTGEAIVGLGVADQRLATGDSVNVAARLEQAAAPDEVLIGESTYAAVQDKVAAEPVPGVPAKGKSAPLAAWRLLDLRPEVPAFSRPIATPFVARRSELETLHRAFGAAVAERTCALATIVGPPGIGKSRLARELVGSLGSEARVLVGRCVSYGDGITYLPLADIVRQVGGDAPEAELARLLAAVDRGDVAARLIAGAVGAGEDAGAPDETAWAFRRLFEALAADRPLVVVVDDIHWAEPALLDLLEYVVGFSSDAPILLLCLARADLLDTRPSWSAPRRHATIVSLEPLAADASAHLVDGLLLGRALPSDLRARIVETAEGNPLFVEQLLAMLTDDPGAAEQAVPASIQALLAARLDRLEPSERSVVQHASVEGRLFHRRVIDELLDRHDGDALGGILLALVRKEFVRPDVSLYPGDDAFRFNHVLIREVAYESLPKESRADLHLRLAGWLERNDPADLAGQAELVGYHLEQAYRYLAELGQLDERARGAAVKGGRLLGAAGRRSLDHGDVTAASSLLGRAAELLVVDPAARATLLPDLGRALRECGELDAADRALGEALVAAQENGDETTSVRAEMELARIAFMRTVADPEPLRELARRAIAVFERIGTDADLADAWQVMGIAELAARDRGAQLAALLRAREHAIASGDVRRQIDAWNEVGGSMLFGRTPVTEVLLFLEDELAWAREHGLAAVEADALLGGPYLLSRLGRFDEAREQLARSKAICRELGIVYGLAEAHSAGALLECLAGDLEAGERELRDGIDVVTRMGAERYAALYRTQLAHVLVDLGRDDDALVELERSGELQGTLARWKTARARLLARQGEIEAAVELAADAVASLTDHDNITARAEELENLAEVLQAAGDAERAGQALTEALALHEEKGNVLQAERCRRLLASRAPL